MKNTSKLILCTIVLLLSSGIAFASAPVATDAAQEAAVKGTGEVVKEAAADVADTATDKAVTIVKEEANKAVDAGMEKATDAIKPAVEETVEASADAAGVTE